MSFRLMLTGLCALSVLCAACVSVPNAERSGLGDGVTIEATDEAVDESERWGSVGDEPALDRLTLRGLVIVAATEQLASPVSGRVVEYLQRPADAVAAGDPLVRIQPTSDAVEELQARSLELEAALGERPSAQRIGELLAARDAAARAVVNESASPAFETITVAASGEGVVVSTPIAPGARVGADEVVVTFGPTGKVELHAIVPNDLLELFLESTGEIAAVGRTDQSEPSPARLAESDQIVDKDEANGTTTIRLVFDKPPPFDDRDRVDVDAAVKGQAGMLTVPASAVRSFDDQAFVLTSGDDGLKRVDVDVILAGPERIQIVGPLVLGDRVLLR